MQQLRIGAPYLKSLRSDLRLFQDPDDLAQQARATKPRQGDSRSDRFWEELLREPIHLRIEPIEGLTVPAADVQHLVVS